MYHVASNNLFVASFYSLSDALEYVRLKRLSCVEVDDKESADSLPSHVHRLHLDVDGLPGSTMDLDGFIPASDADRRDWKQTGHHAKGQLMEVKPSSFVFSVLGEIIEFYRLDNCRHCGRQLAVANDRETLGCPVCDDTYNVYSLESEKPFLLGTYYDRESALNRINNFVGQIRRTVAMPNGDTIYIGVQSALASRNVY